MTFPMAMLHKLEANWDSYGAQKPDERCIQKAYELWRQLSGEWQVVPCNDGGIQLEQHRDGFDIEIQVSTASAQETPAEPVEGVVPGSELELQIQAARKTIAGWPADVKAAMGVTVETAPECRACHGTGVIKTGTVHGGIAETVACDCSTANRSAE